MIETIKCVCLCVPASACVHIHLGQCLRVNVPTCVTVFEPTYSEHMHLYIFEQQSRAHQSFIHSFVGRSSLFFPSGDEYGG